ncbi:MAG: POT family MFS transporter [Verrucomicrobia bacterium]|nr:MAG: POT family MFS transporter [Verrucomicrobiota bacterium]
MNPEVPAPANNRWPPQIKYIIGNEAAERFSYYGMVSILMVYITDVLEKSKDDSAFIIHGFKFFNYFMPLIGAWVSDRFWGRYKTILWISLAYCLGHGVLAFSDVAGTKEARTICLYAGLALIAFGSGGIKPCVSAFLGDQFQSNQRHLLQKAYAAFYWAINFGSFFSMLLIPQIKNHSWAWAFGVPGILMAVATLIFWLGARHYVMVPPARTTRKAGFFAVLVAALKNRSPGKGFWDGAKTLYSETEVRAAASVGPILSIFALIPVFWALFDQTHTTWIAQGQKMIPIALPFDWKLDASAMQSINPLMVMTLVPLLTLVAYPALGRFASPLKRMASGFFLAGFSFVIVAWLQTRVDAGEQMSILWQALPYLILTTAEVLVSTTGLEFAFREAAPSMKSTIMGFWNLSVALGNLVVMGITKVLATADGHGSVTPERFMLYAGMTFVAAILFTLIAAFYKYNDESAAQGK